MFHLVARGADRRLLFRTWTEGVALWRRVVRAQPGLVALVLMPDHLHLIAPSDSRLALAAALSGFARWRNARRDEAGPVFAPLPPAEPLVDDDKRRRSVRYLHLNPCRARLVRDPLAWPLSTHRDAVGLASPAVIRPHPDPARFHGYVSADPSVAVDGTPLPDWTVSTHDPLAVLHAVSALTRTPLAALARGGGPRRLYLQAVAALAPGVGREVAGGAVGVSRWTATRSVRPGPDVAKVGRLLHDPRFGPLDDRDLRRSPGWERYRGR